jgi:hypothetical protein
VISWRYHIVSIVAVILAFGLGILAGSSVVNERFIHDLQLNYDEAIRERNAALADVSLRDRFLAELQPTLVQDRLLGRDVVVVTMEGIERPAQPAVEPLTSAGAEVLASLRLTRQLAEPGAADGVEALQQILATSSTDPAVLADRAARALAVRLAVGPSGIDGDDLLANLLAGGFLTADRDLDQAALRSIGGVSQTVVVAAGGPKRSDVPAPSALLLPLTERLVQLDAEVAVVGPTDDGYGLVAAVRDDANVPDCALVTVDDIDLPIGGIALVLAVERLLEDPDPAFLPGGDYGIDADSLVPGGDPPASCRR